MPPTSFTAASTPPVLPELSAQPLFLTRPQLLTR